MKYGSCQEFMDVYVDNDDIVSMLVMLDDYGKLIGRALLWDFNGYKIMDRIYTNNDEAYTFYFKEWASKNGYLFKSNQNWYDTMNFESIGSKKQELKIDITLPKSEYRYLPYMDTFKFFNRDTGTFSNYHPDGDFYTLCSTDGSKQERDYLVMDIVDNVFRYKYDTCYVEYLDGFTNSNNVNYSDIYDQYILCGDAKYDSELNDYIYNDDNDDNNDYDVIKNRREEIKRRREERELREKEREERREREREERREREMESESYDYTQTFSWDSTMDYLTNILGRHSRRAREQVVSRQEESQTDQPGSDLPF